MKPTAEIKKGMGKREMAIAQIINELGVHEGAIQTNIPRNAIESRMFYLGYSTHEIKELLDGNVLFVDKPEDLTPYEKKPVTAIWYKEAWWNGNAITPVFVLLIVFLFGAMVGVTLAGDPYPFPK